MKIICILTFFMLFYNGISFGEERLIIAFSGAEKNEQIFRMAENLLSEISRRMDIKIKLISLPAKRSTKMLIEGTIHADLSRIAAYKEKVPSAIKVEEPIASQFYYVYTTSQNLTVNGWESLKPYKIVVVRGHIYVKTHLEGANTYEVHSVNAAFKFLKSGRADIFVVNDLKSISALSDPNFDSKGIRKLEPPVDLIKVYTFFSPKYSDYAKKFNAALIAIKKEGLYKKILKTTK